MARKTTGIRRTHSTGCPGRDGGRCRCDAGWEASVYLKRDDKKIRKTFAREAEARSWRADALAALTRGGLRVPTRTTIKEAWEAWIEGAKAGTIRNRSGDPFKPSALRAYSGAMRREVLPELGAVRLSELHRSDLQAFADKLQAKDREPAALSPSAIQVTLLPLRAIFRHAIDRDVVAVNPCSGLRLPAVRSRRERFVSVVEAEALIDAAPENERAIWATAMYAGLRLGELRALRAEDVDLATGIIRVERGWDPAEGAIELKSRAGRRRVPVPGALRDHLTEHVARTGRTGSELMFGRSLAEPFTANGLQRHADEAWEEVELARVTPHELRHSYAAMMIAAGVNAKALQTFMGHAKITITLDQYGHLMPGSEEEAATLADAYVEAQRKVAEDAARRAESRPPVVRQLSASEMGLSGP